MELSRSGATRYRGETRFFKRSAKDDSRFELRFDQKNKTVVFRTMAADPVTPRTVHNYVLTMSLDDVAAIVSLLASQQDKDDRRVVADALAPHTRNLFRLLLT